MKKEHRVVLRTSNKKENEVKYARLEKQESQGTAQNSGMSGRKGRQSTGKVGEGGQTLRTPA